MSDRSWCRYHYWVDADHVCPAIVISPEDEEAALASLDAASAERPALRNVTAEGWELWVFEDCGEWDYVEALTAPDGRRWWYGLGGYNTTNMVLTKRLARWQPKSLEGWPSQHDTELRDLSLDEDDDF